MKIPTRRRNIWSRNRKKSKLRRRRNVVDSQSESKKVRRYRRRTLDSTHDISVLSGGITVKLAALADLEKPRFQKFF